MRRQRLPALERRFLLILEPDWSWGGHGAPLPGLHLSPGFTEELNNAGGGDAGDADEQLCWCRRSRRSILASRRAILCCGSGIRKSGVIAVSWADWSWLLVWVRGLLRVAMGSAQAWLGQDQSIRALPGLDGHGHRRHQLGAGLHRLGGVFGGLGDHHQVQARGQHHPGSQPTTRLTRALRRTRIRAR